MVNLIVNVGVYSNQAPSIQCKLNRELLFGRESRVECQPGWKLAGDANRPVAVTGSLAREKEHCLHWTGQEIENKDLWLVL